MFKKLKKIELQDIYLDYCCSKEEGRRCESFVPFAEQYKEQIKIGDLMSLSTAIDVVTKMFFEKDNKIILLAITDKFIYEINNTEMICSAGRGTLGIANNFN